MPRKASVIALLPLLLAAAGCAADMAEHDQRISHPVTAEQKTAIALFDRVDGQDLSAFDRERLGRLAAESLKRGAGPVRIIVGARPGEEAAGHDFARTLADGLRAGGVADIRVTVAGEAGGEPGAAEVRVPVWVAVVPDCGKFERGITPDYTNAPNSNWGCSIQRNMGLMVQNPADLIRARETSGRDANRASDVLGKYGKGEATGSAAEAKSSGSTSSVGSK
ncbi:CpaD family pilus assembly lipoprotein [Magnetospirillum sp. SS-4]|uniref:CpaD family pilus assembly lipoprotein n=1 Tax=Magnetospirillum sp. SS-4 TaxID=2681465 RepID=UPI00137F2D7F|nr:CpaD family pilus assembly lipoprotein [Magnetospirillum sp. SS-4]CAA7616841.1 Type IV pili component [Magnetospirillum sp. SS-4]